MAYYARINIENDCLNGVLLQYNSMIWSKKSYKQMGNFIGPKKRIMRDRNNIIRSAETDVKRR